MENISKKVKQKLVTDTTLSKYKVTKGYIERYIKTELKKDDVLMKDLSPVFVEILFIYLLKYMTNNTAVQKMKQVKSILRYAVDEGYIKVSPFKIVLKKEKKEVVPLTLEEINIIRKKKIEIARLSSYNDFLNCSVALPDDINSFLRLVQSSATKIID